MIAVTATVLAVGASADVRADPAPLACLKKYYALSGATDAGELVYDDGRDKSFDAKLDDPDLEDLFSIRYPRGPIGPVTEVNHDPGRIRHDALLRATYDPRDLVSVAFFGRRVRVHRKVAPALRAVVTNISDAIRTNPSLAAYVHDIGGTFVRRTIARTRRPSPHAYGIAIDLNVKRSHYWQWQRPATPLRWRNRIPQEIVDAFESEGFIWGGRWYHYDTMHFEYRPELLDPACYP